MNSRSGQQTPGFRGQHAVARYFDPAISRHEEFAIILPDTVAGGAAVVAGRLMISVEHLAVAHASSSSGQVTVSVGVTCSADLPLNTPETLIASADAALYRAKQGARNQVALHGGAGHDAYVTPTEPRCDSSRTEQHDLSALTV